MGTTWIDLSKSNGMSEEDNENITKWDSNFASTLIDHYLLPDINFNGHCLKENNIYIFKKSNKSIYFLHTKSPPPKKKIKYTFYIRWLLIWICKAN